MSSQQSVYVKAMAQPEIRLLTACATGPKPDRLASDSSSRIAIQRKEFGLGEYRRKRLVSRNRFVVRTKLLIVGKPASWYWYCHTATAHSPAYQPRGPAKDSREWYCRGSRGHIRQRSQHRRVGRVSTHSRPKVLRLQQDQRRDCQGDRVQDWKERWYFAGADQPSNLLSKCPYSHPGRFTRSHKGSGR